MNKSDGTNKNISLIIFIFYYPFIRKKQHIITVCLLDQCTE